MSLSHQEGEIIHVYHNQSLTSAFPTCLVFFTSLYSKTLEISHCSYQIYLPRKYIQKGNFPTLLGGRDVEESLHLAFLGDFNWWRQLVRWKKLILLQKISTTNLAISNNFCRLEEKMSLHRSFMDVISVIEWKSYPRPYTGSSKLPLLNTYQEWNVTNTKQCNNHES